MSFFAHSVPNADQSRWEPLRDHLINTGEALFALPERSRVVAGMYLRGTAQLAPRETLAAPQSSILYEDGAPYVFVVQTTRRGGKGASFRVQGTRPSYRLGRPICAVAARASGGVSRTTSPSAVSAIH